MADNKNYIVQSQENGAVMISAAMKMMSMRIPASMSAFFFVEFVDGRVWGAVGVSSFMKLLRRWNISWQWVHVV